MKKIDDLRLKIDEIDKSMLNLLVERLEVVKEIGKLKRENGKKIIDEKREKEVLSQLMEQAKNKRINPRIVKKVWKVLMEISYEIEGGKNGDS